jgi:hypothetical protein
LTDPLDLFTNRIDMTFLNRPISELPDGEVVTFLDQLCAGARFPWHRDPSCTVHDLLSLILQCEAPNLNNRSFPIPNDFVVCRIGKLPEPLWRLASEIARHFKVGIGEFEGRSFLVLLKAVYPPGKKLFAAAAKGAKRRARF